MSMSVMEMMGQTFTHNLGIKSSYEMNNLAFYIRGCRRGLCLLLIYM